MENWKRGSNNIPKNTKTSKNVKKWNMGGGRGGVQRCASNFSLVKKGGLVRKSIKRRFRASEIVCRPVNICTMRRICARTRFWSLEAAYNLKIALFSQKTCPLFVCKKITIQNRSFHIIEGGGGFNKLHRYHKYEVGVSVVLCLDSVTGTQPIQVTQPTWSEELLLLRWLM